MEHLPLDRRVPDDEPLLVREEVEACLEQCVDRRRRDEIATAGALAEHRHHLLDVQRVASRCSRDAIARGLVHLDLTEQVGDQVVALVRAERLEQERRRVQLPASPARSEVEQLRARHAEEEDGRVPREVGDVLDEIDEDGLGPLEIVDHDDLRSLGGAALEQPAKGDARLLGHGGNDALGIDPERNEHLDERPVGDSLAVREAAAAKDVG